MCFIAYHGRGCVPVHMLVCLSCRPSWLVQVLQLQTPTMTSAQCQNQQHMFEFHRPCLACVLPGWYGLVHTVKMLQYL